MLVDMNAFDNTSIDFLEEIADDGATSDYSTQLNEDYVFGLDGLENLDISETQQNIEKAQNILNPNPPTEQPKILSSLESFLDETDVRLRDVVEKVFRRSDRSFVIVRDDKIQILILFYIKSF